MAQVIFEGDQLKPAPGGGICQASTTVYRAIVNAGFPVVERRAHSLYVSYYKKYGVGIDATIFPGTQDLTFLNDTEQPLLIQAYDDGYEAVVNFYGTPDGRTVELQGPYFSTNAPEGMLINDRQVMKNEIVWIQRVNYADGSVKENLILSRYKELPAYVRNEYAYLE
ncbi:MAG: VanW family protein [Candidatus Peribacteria bacterium GW2011_GWB1_54_5]|nr:MAG: VanW family protein [Candidatus Peribacteria bacterium GW2011_GWB1_54_5]KKW40353.1 MAG: VanW family protein [Candidatus Peregrinibacteria bacterium GW2011_GWA2_54_9]